MMIDRTKELVAVAKDFIAKADRGELILERSYAAFKSALLIFETANPWRTPSDELPRKDTLIEVCGYSGMGRNRHFLTYALYMPEYRPLDPWRGVQQDALSDFGWVVVFWRYPEPLPAMLD